MKIAIIGCGHMGKAIATRLAPFHELFLFDRNPEKLQGMAGSITSSVSEAVSSAEWIILAIKPQNLQQSAEDINKKLTAKQLLLSILAGTPLALLRTYFPTCALIRMMPNLALIHGEGIIGLSADVKHERVEEALKPLGMLYWLPEEKMDAFTVLTSSAPAFVCALIEAMVEAGVKMGFTAQDAEALIYPMISGTLALLTEGRHSPTELKTAIASPGGITIAGLKALEESHVTEEIIHTFVTAFKRAQELSKRSE